MAMQLTIDGIETVESMSDSSSEMTTTSVKRAVQTIGIKPVRGELTFLSRRLFHMLVYFIQQDGDQEVYSRTLNDFIHTMNYGSRNLSLLKDTFKDLMHITVEWNSSSKDSEESKDAFILSNFVSEIEVKDGVRGRDVIIEWSFPPKLRRQLLNPEIYTRFTQYYFEFKSRYSVALFEIIERYKTNFNGLTCNEQWEWWVPRITGNSSENMEYRYFKRDVLQVAMKEINKTVKEYQISMLEPVKRGKKVLNIQFKVTHIAQIAPVQLLAGAPEPINTEVMTQMIELGFTPVQAKKIFSANTEDFLKRTLEITNLRAANKALPALASKAAYFKTALAQRYADASVPIVPESLNKPTRKVTKVIDAVHPRDVYAVKIQNDAKAHFEGLSDSAKQGFINNYLEVNTVDGILSAYKKSGLKSSLFKTSFFGWLGEQLYGAYIESEIY